MFWAFSQIYPDFGFKLLYSNFSSLSMKISFSEEFYFRNSVKRHVCDIKNWRLGHDLPKSLNDRVISRGFNFHEVSRKYNPLENFKIYNNFILTLHAAIFFTADFFFKKLNFSKNSFRNTIRD